MRRGIVCLALLSLLAAGGAAADPDIVVTVESDAGFLSVQTAVDGTIVAVATRRLPDAGTGVMLLVAPALAVPAADESADDESSADDTRAWPRPCPADAPPLRLVRAATRPDQDAVLVRSDLPGDATGLEAIDLDGDGVDELILLRPGVALRLGAEPAADVVLLEHEALGGGGRIDRSQRWPGLPGEFLAVNGPDGLTLWRASSGGLEPFADIATRRGAAVWQDVLLSGTRQVDYVGCIPTGLQFVSRPTGGGGPDRLRTQRIVVAPDGAATIEDRWLRLPGPEDSIEYQPLIVDDVPHVLVVSKRGGALGISAEKQLRLYDLTAEGAGLGIEPRFAIESRMNLWQSGTYRLLDVTGDGRDDLVVGYWKGLSDDRVVLDVYAGTRDGFRSSARTTSFDVKDGDRSFVGYGDDVDGDGVPDLLVATEGRLAVHRGTPSSGARLVATKPVRTTARIGGDAVQFFVSAGSGGTDVHVTGAMAPPRVIEIDGAPAVVVVAPATADLPAAAAVVRIVAPR